MHDAGLIDALNDATSLQLYQLAALVDRLITDPKRIVAIRRQLHLGQVVRFYDAGGDQMRLGRVVRLRDTQLIVHGIEWHRGALRVEAALCGAGATRTWPHARDGGVAPHQRCEAHSR